MVWQSVGENEEEISIGRVAEILDSLPLDTKIYSDNKGHYISLNKAQEIVGEYYYPGEHVYAFASHSKDTVYTDYGKKGKVIRHTILLESGFWMPPLGNSRIPCPPDKGDVLIYDVPFPRKSLWTRARNLFRIAA